MQNSNCLLMVRLPVVFFAKLNSYISTEIDEDSNQERNSITLFPNPSTGLIKMTSFKTIDKILITNLLGQKIYQDNPNSKNTSIQLNKSGVYFATLTSGSQSITKKIIIRQ